METKEAIIARLTAKKAELEQELQEVNDALTATETKEVPTTQTILQAILNGAYTVTPPDPADEGANAFNTIVVNVPAQYLLTSRQQRLIREVLNDIEGPSIVNFNFA